LTTLTKRGAASARVQTHARILLLLHRGRTPDAAASALAVGVATVFNVKRRYLGEGLTAALYDKSRSGKPARIDGVARAKITALTCSEAPEGHARWTLRLLADKAVELGFVESVSHNTVKGVLKKNCLKPHLKQTWCHRRNHERVPGADGRCAAPLRPRL
jgi:transposase